MKRALLGTAVTPKPRRWHEPPAGRTLLAVLMWLCAQIAAAAPVQADERLRTLESREAIRELLVAYGRTLDARDFAGFARLFARDAEYVGGGNHGTIRGPEAIGAALRQVFEANPAGIAGASAHLFFNESIEISGNAATAISMGAFAVTGEANRPMLLIIATYHDQFVLEDGTWKFRRREVRSDIPTPGAKGR